MSLFKSISLATFGLFIVAAIASANVKQMKTYREVYPDYKPNCLYCHIEKAPKKEEGKHELNAFGLKLQEMMNGQELTTDMVKTIGNHEDFEAEAQAVQEEPLTEEGNETSAPEVNAGNGATSEEAAQPSEPAAK